MKFVIIEEKEETINMNITMKVVFICKELNLFTLKEFKKFD